MGIFSEMIYGLALMAMLGRGHAFDFQSSDRKFGKLILRADSKRVCLLALSPTLTPDLTLLN